MKLHSPAILVQLVFVFWYSFVVNVLQIDITRSGRDWSAWTPEFIQRGLLLLLLLFARVKRSCWPRRFDQTRGFHFLFSLNRGTFHPFLFNWHWPVNRFIPEEGFGCWGRERGGNWRPCPNGHWGGVRWRHLSFPWSRFDFFLQVPANDPGFLMVGRCSW